MSDGFVMGRELVQQLDKMLREDRARYADPTVHRGRYTDNSTQPCSNTFLFGMLVAPTGGDCTLNLYETGDFAGGVSFVVPFDVLDTELQELIETANGYDPLADPVTGWPARVTGGPAPGTSFSIILKGGWNLSVDSNNFTGGIVPHAWIMKCCGST